MNEFAPSDRPPSRGPRTGATIALVLLAFAAGLLLMAYAMRHLSWFGGTTAAAPHATAAKSGTATDTAATDATHAAADPVALATREAALAAQLATLEARAAAIATDSTAAGTQAARAESILVAAAARRAIDRGQPLGYLEEQLRIRFGGSEPRAVSALIMASHQPVTLETLRQGLDTLGPDLIVNTSNGWWEGLRQELGRLIVIREATAPSTNPTERLARAQRLLDGGQVEAARAEVTRLPGAATAQTWQRAARRYVLARHALDLIENAALVASIATPSPIITSPVTVPGPAAATGNPPPAAEDTTPPPTTSAPNTPSI
ncbi:MULTISPECIES: hypothetical protein [unclassified Sphingomonas]|uniref:hypothetical protein n=1 Tax=unclassified Sphingomonas TaxID=196159 RepID=UPI00285C1D39|nr:MULTISPECIES: hypothetical protein [unclassified Sphingomonas]MDR6114270.1 hypothetical protein [Sphingomonas sp. SORGH_AS_0789]MDR6148370.1 hypothetical protein [Sphingomonas sp. SORGH_AS_0742]